MLENYSTNQSQGVTSPESLEAELLPLKKKKIMVIDDDQDFRLSICEILVEEGYIVTTAKDGEVALNNLVHQTDLPDLILVDLMMPLKNGIQFRREQETLQGISEIPVLFITGHGIIDGELCLQKPFEQRELLSFIRKLLGEIERK